MIWQEVAYVPIVKIQSAKTVADLIVAMKTMKKLRSAKIMNNDLISREALKDYARKVMYEQNATNFSLLKMFDEIIDNAPTVNLEKRSFIEGYKEGCEEGKKCYERPQGKWEDHSDEGYVECPFCGSATTCEDNKDELHYCFNCGAEMITKENNDANNLVTREDADKDT